MTGIGEPLIHLGQVEMFSPAVPDIWVYCAADRLITQHGRLALIEANRLIGPAVERHDADRVLLMMRVRLAVRALQAPPKGPLH